MKRLLSFTCPALAAVIVAFTPVLAAAQGISGLTGGDGQALEIRASEGIAWRRNEKVYVARGDAVATRGNLTVEAAQLTAHYREIGGGNKTEIYRIIATGDVVLSSPTETAYGDNGTYDLDKAVMVLTGRNLKLERGAETITAKDSLEYWEKRNLAVARGNAVARNPNPEGGERRISADILTAYFSDAEGGDDVDRVEAFDNVEISSPATYARGDKGVYKTRTRVATLVGDVKVSRGANQLNGGYAEVNLETGVSRLLGAPPNSDAKAQVRGLLKPKEDGLNAPGAN